MTPGSSHGITAPGMVQDSTKYAPIELDAADPHLDPTLTGMTMKAATPDLSSPPSFAPAGMLHAQSPADPTIEPVPASEEQIPAIPAAGNAIPEATLPAEEPSNLPPPTDVPHLFRRPR